MTGTRVHNTWLRMIDRCRNDRQGNYGSRGIIVCDRWLHSFEAFYEDMGEPPSKHHSIDRRDVNGNYELGNCRWATRKEQARNTTRNTVLRHNGEEKTIAEWAEATGIQASTICHRLYTSGWTVEDALTCPVVERLPTVKPWTRLGMSRSSWYRAGRP
jgi:hypothetical protein